MPKALCFAGMAVSALVLILFTLDLAVGIPLGRANIVMDIVFILCALGLGYSSWSTLQEQ